MFTVFFTCYNSLLFTSACILHSQAPWLNSPEPATHRLTLPLSSVILPCEEHLLRVCGTPLCTTKLFPSVISCALAERLTGFVTGASQEDKDVAWGRRDNAENVVVKWMIFCVREPGCSGFTPNPSVCALSFSYRKLPELYIMFLFFLDTVSLDLRWQ